MLRKKRKNVAGFLPIQQESGPQCPGGPLAKQLRPQPLSTSLLLIQSFMLNLVVLGQH
jgi:hypothetical protein